jgi:hypothetical protein
VLCGLDSRSLFREVAWTKRKDEVERCGLELVRGGGVHRGTPTPSTPPMAGRRASPVQPRLRARIYAPRARGGWGGASSTRQSSGCRVLPPHPHISTPTLVCGSHSLYSLCNALRFGLAASRVWLFHQPCSPFDANLFRFGSTLRGHPPTPTPLPL